MTEEPYLQWLTCHTPTAWWHDSADPEELCRGLALGATGVTTNPFLVNNALRSGFQHWASAMSKLSGDLTPEARAEALMEQVVQTAARTLMPEYERSSGDRGFVCAQVNPVKAADAESMLAMARRIHKWAPDIAVKLPATAAGLEALEECVADGITVAATVSFSVAQTIAVAESHRRGLDRARRAGKSEGRCFAVIMIGRLDDYLRDVAKDCKAAVSESDLQQAGLAVTKRAYQIYRERGYETTLLVAALRGAHHMVGLAGAELIMSIHPKIQEILLQSEVPRDINIDVPIVPEVIRRLETMPEFVKVYEPNGMSREEFITYGVTQRTLTQFIESGWALLESFNPRRTNCNELS